jgi:hypothetical protein
MQGKSDGAERRDFCGGWSEVFDKSHVAEHAVFTLARRVRALNARTHAHTHTERQNDSRSRYRNEIIGAILHQLLSVVYAVRAFT